MISAFSSTLNGTLLYLLCAWTSKETSVRIIACYTIGVQLIPFALLVFENQRCAGLLCETSAHWAPIKGALHLNISLLLNSNLRANLGHFLRDLLGFFLGDPFFNCRGSLVNDCLCLFQTKAGNLTYNFDDIDFVWSNL